MTTQDKTIWKILYFFGILGLVVTTGVGCIMLTCNTIRHIIIDRLDHAIVDAFMLIFMIVLFALSIMLAAVTESASFTSTSGDDWPADWDEAAGSRNDGWPTNRDDRR